MAWEIASWSAEEGRGTIVSPHLGPLSFGAEQNRNGIQDFAVGERVFVELRELRGGGYEVVRLWLEKARQPPGTACADFDRAQNWVDMRQEETEGDRIRLWCGDCCAYCSRGVVVEFTGIHQVQSNDPEQGLQASNALFRLASSDEQRSHGLQVPEGCRAFCIVTEHGNGDDGPLVFIVARQVRVLPGA